MQRFQNYDRLQSQLDEKCSKAELLYHLQKKVSVDEIAKYMALANQIESKSAANCVDELRDKLNETLDVVSKLPARLQEDVDMKVGDKVSKATLSQALSGKIDQSELDNYVSVTEM